MSELEGSFLNATATLIMVLDRQGRIRGYYGMDDESALDRLAKDVKALL